jgi:hypothetical protein
MEIKMKTGVCKHCFKDKEHHHKYEELEISLPNGCQCQPYFFLDTAFRRVEKIPEVCSEFFEEHDKDGDETGFCRNCNHLRKCHGI